MNPRIKSFQYHAGSPRPPVSNLSRTPGYRIAGKGFGDQPGQVEIEYGDDGEKRSSGVKSWSDTFIEIEKPAANPRGWGTWANDLIVTRADGKRSKPFELVRPGNPYVGYSRPQDRRARLCQAA